MGKKYIVEEVEEKKEVGCGSIIIGVIIVMIIAAYGGFKSCNKTDRIEPVATEQTPSKNSTETHQPSHGSTPTNTPPKTESPSTSTKLKLQNEKDETIAPKSIATQEDKKVVLPSNTEENDLAPTFENTREPELTKKERRKAERQAKREARQMEKTQLN